MVALVSRARVPRRWSWVAGTTSIALMVAGLSAAVPAAAVAASAGTTPPAATDAGGLTAPDAVSASVNARLSGKAVEDLSQRTEFGSVYALPDGQWTAQQASGPVWVRQGGDGTHDADWKPLDLTLSMGADGIVRPNAATTGLELAGSKVPTASPASSAKPIAVLGSEAADGTTGLSWDKSLPTPQLQGRRATYKNVSPGLDLVVEATASGFEQFFVANNAAAAQEAVADPLVVTSNKGTASVAKDGTLSIKDSHGKQIATSAKPLAWDAKVEKNRPGSILKAPDTITAQTPRMAALPDVAVLEGKKKPAAPSDSGTSDATTAPTAPIDPLVADPLSQATPLTDAVTVTDPNTAELSLDGVQVLVDDPATTYPVVIDPSVNINRGLDLYVQNDTTVDTSGYTYMQLGTYNGGAVAARPFINFPTTAIAGKHVTNAYMELWDFWSYSCSARAYDVWHTGGISTATRWTNQPSRITKYGTSNVAMGYSSACPGGWVDVDLTSAFALAANNSDPQITFGLLANEADSYGWKKFYSADNGSYIPSAWVTYNSTPNPVASWTYSSTDQYQYYTDAAGTKTLYVKTTKPGYKATVSDPDGGNVRALYSIKEGSTVVWNSAPGSNVASGGTSVLAAGASTGAALVDGHTYTPYAVVSDGSLTSASKTGTTFIVDVTAPAAPSVTSSAYATTGAWLDTQPKANTFTFKSTSADAVTFQYSIDGAAAKTITPNATSGTTGTENPGSGAHVIEVWTLDKAGNKSATSTKFYFGNGGAALTSPTGGLKSTDKFTVRASSPAPASGTVTATVYYRLAGTANQSYDPSKGSIAGWSTASVTNLTQTTANGTVTATGSWSASAAADALGKSRVPVLLDVQVCFNYSVGSVTRCTWNDVDTTDRSTVVRVPHAFGDNFPTADAGPGQVALWTGEFNTSATDVSVPGYVGDLTASRSYSSLAGQDPNSVFGPGWTASFDGVDVGVAGYQVVDSTDVDGTITLVDGEGGTLIYREPGNGKAAFMTGQYTPVDADTKAAGARLSLSGNSTAATLVFTDADSSVTTFSYTGKTGVNGRLWTPVSVTEPGSTKSTSFTTDTATGRVTRILAPVPDGVTCAPSGALAAGCRALNIGYGTVPVTADALTGATLSTPTTATRVTSISYTAFDPTTQQVSDTPVAAYTYDAAGRLSKVTDPRTNLSTTYTYSGASSSSQPLLAQVTDPGRAPWTLGYGNAAGIDAHALQTVTRGAPVAGGASVQVARFVYGIDPTVATSGLPSMTAAAVGAWGQTVAPTYGAAVFGQDHPVGATPAAADWPYADLQYTDDQGRVLNTASYGAGDWQPTATRYDAGGRVVGSWDAGAVAQLRAQTAASGNTPAAADVDSYGTITRYNADITTSTALTWTPPGQAAQTIAAGTVITPAGTLVTDTWAPARDADGGAVREHTHTDYDQGAPNGGVNPSTGVAFRLPTTVSVTQADGSSGSADLTVPVASGESVLSRNVSGYDPVDGTSATGPTSGWMLGQATTTTTRMGANGAASAADLVTSTLYDADGRTIEVRKPAATGGSSVPSADAATTKTYYYTVAAQTGAGAACGGAQFAQWAGLTCLTTTGEATPSTPTVNTTAYNLYLSPATVVEKLGSTTRTTTTTFGKAGRVDTVTVASNIDDLTGAPGAGDVPATQTLYDESTGQAIGTASLNGSTETGRISQTFDLWGRQTSYTDTDGKATTTTYDAAGRVATVVDPTGRTTTYGYDGTTSTGVEHRGLTTSVTVTGGPKDVGTFTGAYDADGKLVSQVLPGGQVTQTMTYDRAGELAEQAYDAVPAGGGDPIEVLAWTMTSDVQGNTTQIDSSLGTGDTGMGRTQAFTYDAAQRLTGVSDTIGTGCTTRAYGFDGRGNRTSLATTSHAAVADGSDPCTGDATTTAKAWTYDGADRLTAGATIDGVAGGAYAYDALGRATTIPAVDTVAGAGDITLGYYDTDAARTLAQGGVTTSFTLDPAGRRAGESTTGTNPDGSSADTQVVRHYTDSSDNPGWAVKTTGTTTTTTWYGGSVGGDLGVQATTSNDGTTSTDTVQLTLSDPLGNLATTYNPDADTPIGATGLYDEYGNTIQPGVNAIPGGGSIDYGAFGGRERATNDTTGLPLMGARLYNPTTAQFTSCDPEPGGNTTAYAYPQDPINGNDLSGRRSFRSRLHSVAHYAINIARATANNLNGTTLIGYAYAAAAGAHCAPNRRWGTTVCTGATRLTIAGGMTIGNVYTTWKVAPKAPELRHEAKHSTQWAFLGTSMAGLYLLSRVGARHGGDCNVFERNAGYSDGNYGYCK